MTTFITGGTSSIGRVLIKEFQKKGEIVRVLARKTSNRAGLDLPGVTFCDGDVTDPRAVQEGMTGCDQVIHMAAVVGSDLPEEEWWRVNRDGTRNVLQSAADLGVKGMVQVSSMSVLGDTQPGETADESRPIDPARHVTLYQKTKFAADELARDFAARGLPVKIVYPGFGFGCSFASSHPSMQDQTLLRMAAGNPVAIMGSGKNRLFLAYYNDTSEAIRLALYRGGSGEGFILGNDNLTFPEIWKTVADILGKQPPSLRIPLPLLRAVSSLGEKLRGKPVFPSDFFDMIALNWSFSNRKAREELGWKPKSFKDALTETWLAYQAAGWPQKYPDSMR